VNTASTAAGRAMVEAETRSPLRQALTNADAASAGDAAGESGMVVGGVVAGGVVVGRAEPSGFVCAVGFVSELQPTTTNVNAHMTTAARRIIEST
jgi:hypothetical protein